MEGLLVDSQKGFKTALALFLSMFRINFISRPSQNPGAQVLSLNSESCCCYYIRRDKRDRFRHVNVFDNNGNKVYTFERKTRLSKIWSFYNSERREIATLTAGVYSSSFDFHEKTDILHRTMTRPMTSLTQEYGFSLSDGGYYKWVEETGYLERIVNPGQATEEVRQRVARARLMRRFRFDYELLIDSNSVDVEIAIVTAFISITSSWTFNANTDTAGPTRAVPTVSRFERGVPNTVANKYLEPPTSQPAHTSRPPDQCSASAQAVSTSKNPCANGEVWMTKVDGNPDMVLVVEKIDPESDRFMTNEEILQQVDSNIQKIN